MNLFRFFLVWNLRLCRAGGRWGVIVPMSVLGDISCANTRLHVLAQTASLEADCFPQKDNAARRVFRDAKLSTVILFGQRRAQPDEKLSGIHIRVFPWNTFDDVPRQARLGLADLRLVDPENLPVPLVSEPQLQLLRKLYANPAVCRLGLVEGVQINRGEINQTIYKDYITTDPHHCRLLKGVEIGRYHQRTTLKQGFREWLDEPAFLKANSPRDVVSRRRIATQRITGVDERWRVVATIIPEGVYFADSTNSISAVSAAAPPLEYLLAFLNSRLWQWRFKLTSSNNNVGTNELACMPIVRWKNDKRQAALVGRVGRLLKLNEELVVAKTPEVQTRLQREIAAVDRAVEQDAGEFFALTPEEMRLIEEDSIPAP